jgi:hypothetical protein
MRAVALPALALLASLSACGEKNGADGPERKTAAGEVLGGTISDAMLPLATVTSENPPLRESTGASGDESGGTSTDTAAADADDAEPASDPAPEPSAAASASATPQAED